MQLKLALLMKLTFFGRTLNGLLAAPPTCRAPHWDTMRRTRAWLGHGAVALICVSTLSTVSSDPTAPPANRDHLYPTFVDDGYFTPGKHNPFRQLWANASGATTKLSLKRRLAADDDLYDDDASMAKMDCTNPDCSCYYDEYDDEDCGTSDEECPCCIRCLNEEMSYCHDALGGKLLEDQYYPTEKGISGSCDNLDERVGALDVFGKGKTFRDSDECRDLVREYVCLWWGSENAHYENRCNNGGQAAKPCRDFCVQVGLVCANNEDWMNLCYDIPCSAGDGPECTPAPYATSFLCSVYEFEGHAYSSKATWVNAGHSVKTTRLFAGVVASLVAVLLLR